MTEEGSVQQVLHVLREVVSDIGLVKRKMDAALKLNQKQFKETNLRIDQLLGGVQHPATSSHVTGDGASDLSSTASLSSASEDRILEAVDRRTMCMANAFQRNVNAIIHNISFDMIQDLIVERGLVTTKESIELRQLQGDRTRMRILVTNIMDKEINAMMTFLDLIKDCDQMLKERIQSDFDSSIDDSHSTECTACLIQRRLNIQDLSDSLFAQEVISRNLYTKIARNRPIHMEEQYWKMIFDAISLLPRTLGATALERALTEEEGIPSHADIVRHINRDLARNRKSSHCRCSRNNNADRTHRSSRQSSDIRTHDCLSEDELSEDSDQTISEASPASQRRNEQTTRNEQDQREVSTTKLRQKPPIPSGKPSIGLRANTDQASNNELPKQQSRPASQIGAMLKSQTGDSHRRQSTASHSQITTVSKERTGFKEPHIARDEERETTLTGDSHRRQSTASHSQITAVSKERTGFKEPHIARDEERETTPYSKLAEKQEGETTPFRNILEKQEQMAKPIDDQSHGTLSSASPSGKRPLIYLPEDEQSSDTNQPVSVTSQVPKRSSESTNTPKNTEVSSTELYQRPPIPSENPIAVALSRFEMRAIPKTQKDIQRNQYVPSQKTATEPNEGIGPIDRHRTPGEDREGTPFSKLIEKHEQISNPTNAERKKNNPKVQKYGNSKSETNAIELGHGGNRSNATKQSGNPFPGKQSRSEYGIPLRPIHHISPKLARKMRQLNKEEDIPEED